MDSTTLNESCQDWNQNLSIDEGQRLVKNVALTGQQSKNGYTYSEKSLSDAVSLYEGKPVFLDHATDRTRPQERSTRDLVGSITHPRFQQGRIHGDIKVLDTDSGKTFLKLLDIESPGIGMSHVVKAKRSIDGKTVDEIIEVISVDAVVNPATTNTFSESTNSNQSNDTKTTDAVLELRSEISELVSEQQRLKVQNQELCTLIEKLENQKQVADLIAESRLPDNTVTEFFVSQLESTSNKELRQKMIRDRLSILSSGSSSETTITSRERTTHFESAQEDENFIRVIRQKHL